MIASPAQAFAHSQPMSGRHRAGYAMPSQPRVLAYVGVIAGLSGVLSAIPGLPVLQSLLMLILLVAGAGSAALCWLELPAGAAVAGVIGLSIAGVIALATSLAWLRTWYPVPSCLLLSLTVAVIGLMRLWTLRGTSARAEPKYVIADVNEADIGSREALAKQRGNRANAKPYIAVALLVLALGIWLNALRLLHRDTGGQYGLLVTPGGALLITATAVAVTGFVVAIVEHRTLVAALAILVVIILERVTVTLITEVPIYTWTYKHIGLVDYIIKNHSLAPFSTDVYIPWPGFFTAMAWFSSITGLDPVDAAHWFSPIAATLIAIMVGALALSFGLSMRAVLIAGMLAQLVNWVGQDYYSPQAVGLIMAFAILALLAYSRRFVAAGYLSLPIFTVLVATHQLTPTWVCAVAIALAVFRQIRPRWASAIYVSILATYVLPRLDSIKRFGLFTGFNPVANSATVSGRGSDGRLFTVLADRGLSVSVWLLAAVCIVLLWRQGRVPWAAAIMAYSPMLLLAGQNYGGEAILRVFLFSFAGCTVLVAPFFARALTLAPAARRLMSMAAAWIVLIAFALAGMQGYYGGWSFFMLTRTQLEQGRWLLATNQAGATITVMAPPSGWPERPSADYVRFALADSGYDAPLEVLRTSLLRGVPTAEDMDRLEIGARAGGKPLYIVLPRQLYAYDEWIGLFQPGALEGLKEQLSLRPGWTKVINDADTVVFRYFQRDVV
jgi:hypothetical protein